MIIINLDLKVSMLRTCAMHFTLKSVIKYYTIQSSSVFTCFLDAAKAFDRVSHWTLFSKLIQRNILLVIVIIFAFWYQTQPMCIKWGKFNSTYFKVQIVYTKAGCYCSNSLLYTCILMIYLKVLLCVNLVAILMNKA